MKKVLKYGTGHEVPSDAKYLCTQVETLITTVSKTPKGEDGEYDYRAPRDHFSTKENKLVWHYYEVQQ